MTGNNQSEMWASNAVVGYFITTLLGVYFIQYGYLLLLFQNYEKFLLFVTHPKLHVEQLCFVY